MFSVARSTPGDARPPAPATAAAAGYQVPVWSTGDLGAPGVHNVRIERYVYPNGTGSTKYLTLDAVDIWGAASSRET